MVDWYTSNKQSFIQNAEYAKYAKYAEYAKNDLISSDLCTPPAQKYWHIRAFSSRCQWQSVFVSIEKRGRTLQNQMLAILSWKAPSVWHQRFLVAGWNPSVPGNGCCNFCMPNQESGVTTKVTLCGVGFLQTQGVLKCPVLCIMCHNIHRICNMCCCIKNTQYHTNLHNLHIQNILHIPTIYIFCIF